MSKIKDNSNSTVDVHVVIRDPDSGVRLYDGRGVKSNLSEGEIKKLRKAKYVTKHAK